MNDIILAHIGPEDRQVFDNIDAVVSRALQIGDPLIALEYGRGMKRRQDLEGMAVAKLMWRLQGMWETFLAAGTDDDLYTMIEVHMGYKPATAKKYIDAWQGIFENQDVPDDIKAILMGRTMQELLLMAPAIAEGVLAGDDLRSVALSSDKDEIRAHIRRVRGEQTLSKNSIVIVRLMRDKGDMVRGTLYAKQGDERVVIGMLPIPDSGLAEKAVARIVNAVGVQEVF